MDIGHVDQPHNSFQISPDVDPHCGLDQARREALARFHFRRGYRLQRRIAQGDASAIRERDALSLSGRLDMFWPRMCLVNRGLSDRLRRPTWLRAALRRQRQEPLPFVWNEPVGVDA